MTVTVLELNKEGYISKWIFPVWFINETQIWGATNETV